MNTSVSQLYSNITDTANLLVCKCIHDPFFTVFPSEGLPCNRLIPWGRCINQTELIDQLAEEPSATARPELLVNARSFRLVFVSFTTRFRAAKSDAFFSFYSGTVTLTGGGAATIPRMNQSKTLNEHRVFKHAMTAHSAAGVWVKPASLGGGGGEHTSDEC